MNSVILNGRGLLTSYSSLESLKLLNDNSIDLYLISEYEDSSYSRDLYNNLKSLIKRSGGYVKKVVYHPGYIDDAKGISLYSIRKLINRYGLNPSKVVIIGSEEDMQSADELDLLSILVSNDKSSSSEIKCNSLESAVKYAIKLLGDEQ